MKEYSSEIADIFVSGQIQAVIYNDYSIRTKKSVNNYVYHGKRVREQTFCFVNTVTDKKFKTLKARIKDNGVVTRIHGNTKNLPKN